MTAGRMNAVTMTEPTVLTADEIEIRPAVPLGSLDGVDHTVLWHDDTSMAGVLRVAAGRHLGEHTHRRHHHHIWVLDGTVTIFGKELGPGAYVHVPSGVAHDLAASEFAGGTVFFLYIRYEPEA